MGVINYYIVNFRKDDYHKIKEMRDWCDQNLSKTSLYLANGTSDDNIRVLQFFGETFFYFKSKEEYNWFILRWG